MNSGFAKMKLLIHGLLLPIFLLGCATKTVGEEEQLKIVIAKYNNALVEAYKNQFFEPLKEVADDAELTKVNTIIRAYLQNEQIMDSEILAVVFKGIKKKADSAVVKTSEDWKYRWVDYRTNKEVEPFKKVHYEMIYYLFKKDGKWLVTKVEEAT